MRVFVGVSFGANHETVVCGASDCRESARRLVEQVRNEMLDWSREALDGPDGGAGLDDRMGLLVGKVLAFDVAGAANLDWSVDADSDCLVAESVYHDDGTALRYELHGSGDDWVAEFDGREFAKGTLEHCMAACRKSEDEAILAAVQNQGITEGDGVERHGRLLWMLQRMLNPEDLGMSVPPHVRDEIRDVLGLRRCES